MRPGPEKSLLQLAIIRAAAVLVPRLLRRAVAYRVAVGTLVHPRAGRSRRNESRYGFLPRGVCRWNVAASKHSTCERHRSARACRLDVVCLCARSYRSGHDGIGAMPARLVRKEATRGGACAGPAHGLVGLAVHGVARHRSVSVYFRRPSGHRLASMVDVLRSEVRSRRNHFVLRHPRYGRSDEYTYPGPWMDRWLCSRLPVGSAGPAETLPGVSSKAYVTCENRIERAHFPGVARY